MNNPFEVPALHAGDVVEVVEADVFDYMLERADGTRQGGETSKLLEKRQL
ncbi:MAG: hypothetical protein QM767_10025 [Anaeromyxobacter sp.]